MLHKAVFRILMKQGMVDDMFKINSPWLQEFIETEMCLYDKKNP
jgi:hypothetical protein